MIKTSPKALWPYSDLFGEKVVNGKRASVEGLVEEFVYKFSHKVYEEPRRWRSLFSGRFSKETLKTYDYVNDIR